MKQQVWLSRITLLWAGIVVGCSFIATPAKFQAPSLTLSTALEVGRVTFRSMAFVELALVIVGAALFFQLHRVRSLFWLAVAIFGIQWVGVMPLLNARTDAVVQGRAVEGPPWHIVYILLEAVKVVLLLVVAFRVDGARHGADQAGV